MSTEVTQKIPVNPPANQPPVTQEGGEVQLSFTSAMAAAFYTDTFEETNKNQRAREAEVQKQRLTKLREELAKIILPDAYIPKQVSASRQQQFAVIVILAQVMIAQARTNSEQWKTYWRQATEDMNTQIRFAPIVKKATIAAAEAQANATRAEASKQMQTAISSGIFAGLSVIGGAMDSYKAYKQERTSLAVSKDAAVQKLSDATARRTQARRELTNNKLETRQLENKPAATVTAADRQKLKELKEQKAELKTKVANAEIEVKHARTAKLKAEAKVAQEKANNDQQDANLRGEADRTRRLADEAEAESRNLHTLPNGRVSNESTFGTKAKRAWEGFKDGSNAINEGVGKAAQKSHFWGMMSSVSGASIASVADTQKAFYEAQAGTLRAEGQMGESYAQYYGQNYQRTSELLQNALQTFDSTINMLQQATNRHGETIQRLFG